MNSWVVFYVIYNIRVRVVSDIQTLAFGSDLYTTFITTVLLGYCGYV
jgi:hypothetical protein